MNTIYLLPDNIDLRHMNNAIEYAMNFHQIFGNHGEKYALDCGTITNLRIIQSLGSLMDNSLLLIF